MATIEYIEPIVPIEPIVAIESRFKEVTGLTHLDLSIPHFSKGDNQQQKTSKSDYRNFGFVTTPLWLGVGTHCR